MSRERVGPLRLAGQAAMGAICAGLLLAAVGLRAAEPAPSEQPAPPPSVDGTDQQQDRLCASIVELLGQGRPAEVLSAAEEWLALVRNAAPAGGEGTAACLRLAGRLREYCDDLPGAERAYQELLALRQRLHGASDWRATRERARLADFRRRAALPPAQRARLKEADRLDWRAAHRSPQTSLEEAIDCARQAAAIRQTVLGPHDLDQADGLLWLGGLDAQVQRWEEAQAAFEQAAAIEKERLGEAHPGYASALNLLGYTFSVQGHFAKAYDLHARAAHIRERSLGRDHIDYAHSVRDQGKAALGGGRLVEAAKCLDTAVAAAARAKGQDSTEYADLLLDAVEVYQAVGNYRQAAESLTAANQVYDKNPATEPSMRIRYFRLTLSWLTDVGSYREAEDMLTGAREAVEVMVAQQDVESLRLLSALTDFYLAEGKPAQAEQYAARAVSSGERLCGQRTRFYADLQRDLAFVYYLTGRLEQAEKAYGEILAILEEKGDRRQRDYALTLVGLASVCSATGNPQRALQLCRDAEQAFAESGRQEDPLYADVLASQACYQIELGDYDLAQGLLRRTLDVQQRVFGVGHPKTVPALRNLGVFYHNLGDLPMAKTLLQAAFQIAEGADGQGISWKEMAELHEALGTLCHDEGDSPEAVSHLRRAVEIREQALGVKHVGNAPAWGRIGSILSYLPDDKGAEEAFRKAVDLYEQADVQGHPGAAIAQSNLGWFLSARGRYAEAEPHYDRALRLAEQTVGRQHEIFGHAAQQTGWYYACRGNGAAAGPLLKEALAIRRRQLDLTVRIQSERQQLLMAQQFRSKLDDFLAFARKFHLPGRDAYDQVLTWKGAVFARQRWLREIGRWQGDEKTVAQWQDAVNRLAAKASSAPPPDQCQAWQQEIVLLTHEVESLEVVLGTALEPFRAGQQPSRRTPEDIQSALPAASALVDLLEYEDGLAEGQDRPGLPTQRRLAAFVLRRDRPIVQLDLGPAAPISVAVQQWREHGGLGPDGARAAQQLRGRVWEPLAKHLAGAGTVLVCPDGALAQFPWAALPGSAPGTYLLEEIALAVVPVPQSLPELLAAHGPPRAADAAAEMLLVGDVNFDADPGRPDVAAPGKPDGVAASRAVRAGGPLRYSRLPGFANELAQLRDLFQQTHGGQAVRELGGAQATEEAFRRDVTGKRFVHLITHAYFAAPAAVLAWSPREGDSLPPPSASPPGAPRQHRGSVRLLPPDELRPDPASLAGATQPVIGLTSGVHPGLLSGIVLAGANRYAPPADPSQPAGDDGILTALEVALMDLNQARLVVLSACETGLGESAGGEGLLGLQRAFQVAGAKTVVASLWKVDDTATVELMTHFYRNLWEQRLPPLEALRQAQLALLNRAAAPSTQHAPNTARPRTPPRLWAAWVLSGDPGVLKGSGA